MVNYYRPLLLKTFYGHGNNPATTGQSNLEGKFSKTDTGKTEGIFVNTTIDK